MGDVMPINLVAFDPRASRERTREVIGVYCLYGIRIVSETRTKVVVRARPWPAFNNLDGQEWAALGLDMVEFFLENDLTFEDGRTISFEGMDFSLYYRPEGDRSRTDQDARVEWIARELALRKTRPVKPLETTEATDVDGRKRVAVETPIELDRGERR